MAYRLQNHKKKGIVLTTELILLLTAVIAIVAIASYGLGRTILAQATSSKSSLVVEQVNAWVLGSNTYYNNNAGAWYTTNVITVSMYVQNVGNTPVTLSEFGVTTLIGSNTTSANNIQIQPGETKEISFTISLTVRGFGTLGAGNNVYVYVDTSSNTQVGTATTLQNPT